MKIKTILPAMIILASSSAYAAGSANACSEFSNSMIKKVVMVFHDKNKNEVQKKQQLSSIFQEAVDTDWIGKFVLGKFWKETNSTQQNEYLADYKTYVTSVYVSKFKNEDGLSVDDINIASITPGKDSEYIAKTIIKSKDDDDLHVDYLLAENNGKCRVHDITIEGISLLTSERSEFSALASKSGVDGVISTLKKHAS